MANSPAFPMSRKNQTLPVRLRSSGTAYLGFLRRSRTAKKALSVFLFTHDLFTLPRSSTACGGGLCSRAARRMKGVVSPQARPTRMKEST